MGGQPAPAAAATLASRLSAQGLAFFYAERQTLHLKRPKIRAWGE